MNRSTRRHFLKSTSVTLSGIAFTGLAFDTKKYIPRLAFSTLGCPDWSYKQILDFAADNKYTGIEVRGIQRELDLTKCPEFSSPENIRQSRRMAEKKGLHFVDLGSSAEMHHGDQEERNKNLEAARRFIDLARQLDCPYVRVFPNDFPKDRDKDATIDLIASALSELGEYAKEAGVTVLMETHGQVVHSDDVLQIMTKVHHPNVGLVWDIVNMWSVTKEPPDEVYRKLKEYIHHTHIKDLKISGGKEEYTLLGRGDTPIFQAIDILARDNFSGYFSFEWEKMWHPEIPAPEIALADYPKAMRQHFGI